MQPTKVPSEQDMHAAADSMEIIRDVCKCFVERKRWRSTTGALSSLEQVHQMGASRTCVLQSFHLLDAGQAVLLKRVVEQEGEENVTSGNETAHQVRQMHVLHFACLWTTCHATLG
jgi:hypothetical protein